MNSTNSTDAICSNRKMLLGATQSCILLPVAEMEEKFVRHSFSFPPELLEKVRGQTDNMSAYVRSLIENDLAGRTPQPQALSPTIIYDLARVLIGELDAQDLEKNLAGRDQRRMLQEWLRSLLEEPAKERLDIRAAIKAQESPTQKILREAREREKNSGVA